MQGHNFFRESIHESNQMPNILQNSNSLALTYLSSFFNSPTFSHHRLGFALFNFSPLFSSLQMRFRYKGRALRI
ncbi:hypothetical protein RIF29_14102 [Crotalaria pallida]|uniref:Uncharacterized protein n=1 Tax=Crotalaria pallida TaxID=3830 RepID=A0AAN9IHY0_CROPI